MTNVIELKDIDAGYGESQALWGLSLTVSEGSITIMLGSNGAGKTTTMRVLMGILKPWKGHVLYRGRDITKTQTHKRAENGMIMVPEGRRLWPQLTVYEHLELGAYTKRAKDKFDENLSLVYELFPILKERRDQLAMTLSGGEQQMLAIARALMSAPSVLLLDEPSLGLMPKYVIEVMDVIKKLNEYGLTIFLVEQNVHMATRIADYGYVLEQGRIVFKGDQEALLSSEKIKKAYLGI